MLSCDFATPNALRHVISRPGNSYSPSDYSAKCSLEAILKAGDQSPKPNSSLAFTTHSECQGWGVPTASRAKIW